MRNFNDHLVDFKAPELITNLPDHDEHFNADVAKILAEFHQQIVELKRHNEVAFCWGRQQHAYGPYTAAELVEAQGHYRKAGYRCTKGDTTWFYTFGGWRAIMRTELWHQEGMQLPDPMGTVFRQGVQQGFVIVNCRFEKAPARACRLCGVESVLKCSKCKRVYYCGAACQSHDWDKHKRTCK